MVIQISTPPTKGIFPVYIFMSDGLSTNPIFRATLRIKNHTANEINKVSSKSINIIILIQTILKNMNNELGRN